MKITGAADPFCAFGVVPPKGVSLKLCDLVAQTTKLKHSPANGAKAARLLRRLMQNYVSTLESPVSEVALRSGARYRIDLRDHFAASIYFGYLQERHHFDIFQRLVRSGMTVVDVGANFGLYTIQAGLLAGPGGRVLSIEPVPAMHALIEANAALNGLEAIVSIHPTCALETERDVTFFINEDYSFSSIHRSGRNAHGTPLALRSLTIDQATESFGHDVDLMKIDVEGAELGVLLGSGKVLANSPGLIVQIELTRKNLADDETFRTMAWLSARISEGFKVFFWDRGRYGPITPDVIHAGEGNVFLCAPGGDAEARLTAAFEAENALVTGSERDENLDAERFLGDLLTYLDQEEIVAQPLKRQVEAPERAIERQGIEDVLSRLAGMLPPERRPTGSSPENQTDRVVKAIQHYIMEIKQTERRELELFVLAVNKILPAEIRPAAGPVENFARDLAAAIKAYVRENRRLIAERELSLQAGVPPPAELHAVESGESLAGTPNPVRGPKVEGDAEVAPGGGAEPDAPERRLSEPETQDEPARADSREALP